MKIVFIADGETTLFSVSFLIFSVFDLWSTPQNVLHPQLDFKANTEFQFYRIDNKIN